MSKRLSELLGKYSFFFGLFSPDGRLSVFSLSLRLYTFVAVVQIALKKLKEEEERLKRVKEKGYGEKDCESRQDWNNCILNKSAKKRRN